MPDSLSQPRKDHRNVLYSASEDNSDSDDGYDSDSRITEDCGAIRRNTNDLLKSGETKTLSSSRPAVWTIILVVIWKNSKVRMMGIVTNFLPFSVSPSSKRKLG